jgi:hypothetical protein
VLIGEQCFSGHNMQVAIRQPNACALASAAPFEPSYTLAEGEIPKGSPVANNGFSTYSYYFSCAFHHQDKTGNLAAAQCPSGESADFDQDGKVSFAEAHYFALSHMNSYSSPQISSQVYARSVLKQHGKTMSANELAEACHLADGGVDSIKNQISSLVDPAMMLSLTHRLEIERAVIAKLFSDSALRKDIEAKPKDSLDTLMTKLLEAYGDFQAEHQDDFNTISNSLKALNQNRDQMAKMRESMLESLIKKEASIKADYEKMRASEKRLSDSTLTPEQLQIEQNEYERSAGNVQRRIDQEMEKPPYKAKKKALMSARQKLIKKIDLAEAGEYDDLQENADVRRAYEMLEGYYAESQILKSGSAEEKAKLIQLYECENGTL